MTPSKVIEKEKGMEYYARKPTGLELKPHSGVTDPIKRCSDSSLSARGRVFEEI